MPLISIVLPAYNEADGLENAVNQVKARLEDLGYDYEIIIAEDGSTDGTDVIAKRLEETSDNIRHLHSDVRLGRGEALKRAFKVARGDIIVYMDVDLSTSLEHLDEIIKEIERGNDVSTGSRRLRGSKSERPFKRDFMSAVYNSLVRLFLGSKLRDHQCGFKAFRRESVMKVLDEVKNNHWFWDTEILVRAQKKGLRISEIPVKWKQSSKTKVRVLKDSIDMGLQILRLWLELRGEPSKKRKVLSLLIGFLIIAGLGVYIGAGDVARILLSAKPGLIALASIVYLGTWHARGLRYRAIMEPSGYRIGTNLSTASIAVSQTANLITPARAGDLARAYIFKKRGVPLTTSISALALERIFDAGMVIFLAVGSLVFLQTSLPGWIGRTITYSFFALLSIVIIVGYFSSHSSVFGRIFREIRSSAINKKVTAISIPLTAIIWIIDIVVCYIILSSFGMSGELFPLVALGVTIATLTKIVPVTPGGIGTYELALSAVLSLEISPGIAFSTALLDHLIKNIITLIAGAVSIVYLNMNLRDIMVEK